MNLTTFDDESWFKCEIAVEELMYHHRFIGSVKEDGDWGRGVVIFIQNAHFDSGAAALTQPLNLHVFNSWRG